MNNRIVTIVILFNLLAVLALSVLLSPGRAEEPVPILPAPKKKNIVFVLLDAARSDHFSCYGYDKKTTPNIDALSCRGAIFLKNFSPATETFNSLPLIFSSRYYSKEIFQKDTWQWGVRRESSPSIFVNFDLEQIILPELLSRNGYRTVIIHDHWWFLPQTDLIASFDEHVKVRTQLKRHPADGAMITQAQAWIEKNRNKPFFLYLHIMSPHQPYPPKLEDRLFTKVGESEALDRVRRKFANKPNESARGWSPEDLSYLNSLYDSNLRHSDAGVGQLYEFLEQEGLADDTLFIISSDHGENLGQHGLINHGGPPWDSATHVPLIMILPREIPAGVQVQGLSESIDIMPTIIDLCDLDIPPGKRCDGVSLKKFIITPQKGKETVYTQQSVRTPEYKYMLNRDALFNILSDPREEDNIISYHPEMAKKLAGKHDSFMESLLIRYQSVSRPGAPPYPFFLPLREFRFFPGAALQVCAIGKSPLSVLGEINPEKTWMLNKSTHYGGLFCLPDRGVLPPAILSIRMPDGTYRVSVLVENLGEIHDSAGDVGMESRFDPAGRFLAPKTIKNAPGARYCYLDWGEVVVKNNRFSVELSVRTDKKTPFFLHHVRFDPMEASRGVESEVPGDKEMRERREGLKSLGYM